MRNGHKARSGSHRSACLPICLSVPPLANYPIVLRTNKAILIDRHCMHNVQGRTFIYRTMYLMLFKKKVWLMNKSMGRRRKYCTNWGKSCKIRKKRLTSNPKVLYFSKFSKYWSFLYEWNKIMINWIILCKYFQYNVTLLRFFRNQNWS